MPKQHEVVALATGKKGDVERAMTDAYHVIDKPDLFDAVRRTYRPLDEVNGEKLPPETKNAQQNLTALVKQVCGKLVGLFDVTLTLDGGNQVAKADVVIEGGPTVKDVPVSTLLFLEKQLENVKAFVTRLPTPDAAEVWEVDANQGMLATRPTETHRTKKTQRPIVLYDATDKHPAQTELFQEDVLAGYWTTIKYTTRVPAVAKAAMLERVEKLRDAVRVAREKANAADVPSRKMGDDLIGYLFEPMGK